MSVVSHDAITRTELHVQVIQTMESCTFCGGVRRGGRMFRYRTKRDDDLSGSRAADHTGVFCRKSCHDAYHS